MKSLKYVLAFIMALVLAWTILLFASPYMELRSLRASLASGNQDAVMGNVDMDLLRQSAREQMKKQVLRDLTQNPEDVKAAKEAVALLGPLVNQLITPARVMAMLRGQKFDATGAPMEAVGNVLAAKRFDVNAFVLHVQQPMKEGETAAPPDLAFIFSRQHGLSWKVTQIIFHE